MDWVLGLGDWLLANPAWSAPLYVLAFALIMAVGVPGGNALMLLAGFLFGWWMGGLLTTIGGVLAAWLTHVLVSTTLGHWLDQRAARFRSAVRDFVASGNAILLVLPRLVPVFPFFALNVGFTASGVPLFTYLWTTAAGLLPLALLVCRIGGELRGVSELNRETVAGLFLSPGVYGPLLGLMALTLAGWGWLRLRRPA